jgi:release factor glutamine methyltransferase
MITNQALNWAIKKLRKNKISSPALDAEILLAFTIKKPKEFLFAHPEKKLTGKELAKFKKLIARRAKHEPIAYITDHKYFYGLDFFVNKNVLIPRPETEILVEQVLKIVEQPPHLNPLPNGARRHSLPFGERVGVRGNQPLAIIDVGTGSGAIAVSLARRLPGAKIFATEISPGALTVAKKNIKHHKVAVELLRGNLLEPLLKRIMNYELRIKELIVVANLPYLTTKQWSATQLEIKKYEPRQALDGGPDGLKYHKQLLQQIKLLVTRYLPRRQAGSLPVTSIFEIDPSQTKPITKIIQAHFPATEIKIKKDLAGRDRIVILDISY